MILRTVIAFICVFFLICLLKPAANKIGLVDHPGGRKDHTQSTPLVGGLAIFFGVALTAAISFQLSSHYAFFSIAGLLVLVGVLDDLYDIPSRVRLIFQIVAGLLMVFWGGVVLSSVGNLLGIGNIALTYLSVPLTVFAVVGMINALNMIDGLDGLSGGLSLVALCLLLIMSFMSGEWMAVESLLLILAGVFAFLCFNFPLRAHKRASVFLGDAGSMLLGFVLAWFLISLSQAPQQVASPVVMLWIVAVPLFDMVSVVIRRVRAKKSPFAADRNHMHHILLQAGYSKRQVTFVLCGSAILIGVCGLLGYYLGIPDALLFLVFMLLFIVFNVILWKINLTAKAVSCEA